MKLSLSFSIFLFTLLTFSDESLSLSDYQIKKICKKDQRRSTCIKKLQKERSKLQEGKLIEIPVIPYKR